MARPLRIEYEGAVYHITARGNERSEIYFTKKDYEKFLEYENTKIGYKNRDSDRLSLFKK